MSQDGPDPWYIYRYVQLGHKRWDVVKRHRLALPRAALCRGSDQAGGRIENEFDISRFSFGVAADDGKYLAVDLFVVRLLLSVF